MDDARSTALHLPWYGCCRHWHYVSGWLFCFCSDDTFMHSFTRPRIYMQLDFICTTKNTIGVSEELSRSSWRWSELHLHMRVATCLIGR